MCPHATISERLCRILKETSMRFIQRKAKSFPYIITLAIVALLIVQIFSFLPDTTESADAAEVTTHPTLSRLMYQIDGDGNPKGYRAYMEYALKGTPDSSNLGIQRQTVLYVYACAGETICLGSDITGSLINADEVRDDTGETGVDIVLTAPDGTKMTFNNEEGGRGYIGTLAQEAAGANYTGSNNTAGYIPHEYTVRTTGIYEVRFHAYSGSISKGKTGTHQQNGTNPSPIKTNSNDWKNSGVTIGAFDITVVRNGVVKTGRSYAKYLALNTGQYYSDANTKRDFAGEFYNVTTDGYIYKNTFDISPWGFIFFTNSRGIVDTTTGNSVYHSYRTDSGDVKDVSEKTIRELGGSLHKPGDTDTALDQTYMTFFEMPDENLEGVLYQRAYAPEVIEDFTFVGAKEANITYVGSGGYFKFDVKNAMAVTITISFDEYNKSHNTNYEPVEIKSSVEKGTNYIFWDGNDGAGTEVEAGWYKSDQIEVKIQSHAGEYHFPFIDVEDSFGLTFERVNKIYDYKDGVLTDVTSQYEKYRYTIYYDNRAIPGVSVPNATNPITVLGDKKNCSSGVDSKEAVMTFTGRAGDATLIDIWTYALSEIQEMKDTNLVVQNLDGYYPVTLEGFVFFDKDNNSYYDLSEGDFALSDVEVTLDYTYCGTRWTITSDESTGLVTKLEPAYYSTTDEYGNELREYYYHDYEVRRGDDGLYYLYQYAAANTSHSGEPSQVLNTDGHPVTVTLEEYKYDVKTEDEVQTITDYKVWIPVHLETTTNSVGQYRFTGVLINKNGYRNQDANGVYDNFTITVKNPDADVYQLTTANTKSDSCDFANLKGTETQVIGMEELYTKAQASDNATTDLIYDVSDVGYYYETYEPPLTVVKIWGSETDYREVQSITFTIEGFISDAGDHYGEEAYTREVTILYSDGWDLTLTDLPAKAKIGNTEYTLSYRIRAESFSNKTGTYRYTEAGGWQQLVTDSNGNTSWTSCGEVYAAYFTELQHAITGDYLYANNFPAGSTLINLYKRAEEDQTTPLAGATFQLQKLVEGSYVDVTTSQGSYLVTTDENGYARFLGLTDGTYRLVEMVAPEHYRTISDVTFMVPLPANYDGSVTFDSTTNRYNATIYDRLIDAPVSEIQKYDQYGNPIQGAEFEIYAADKDYTIRGAALTCNLDDPTDTTNLVLTTDENGKAQFKIRETVQVTVDGVVQNTIVERPMTIPELRRLSEMRIEGGTDYFVLKETKVPSGYRSVGEANLMIVGSGMNSYIFCMNPYESGVWCMASATVYAQATLQEAGGDRTFNYITYSDNGNAATNGSLFAVIMKRNGAEAGVTSLADLTGDGWEPVYGTDTEGYHILSLTDRTSITEQTEKAIQAYIDNGQRSLFTQDATDPTQISVHLENFPGDILEYYTNVLNNGTAVDDDTPEYYVAYYYSTETDAKQMNAKNTWRVTSHAVGSTEVQAFPIYWSTTIKVPDIRNALFVQKTSDQNSTDSNDLIDNAVFGLYEAMVDSDGNGYYVGSDTAGNTVYIRLAEDDSLAAEVYTGTVTEDGILTNLTKISSEETAYTVDATGCEDAPDNLKTNDGYVNATAGYITVTQTKEYEDGDTVTTIWSIIPANNAKNQKLTSFTHDTCDYVEEKGTAHMYYLLEGTYFLKEIYVPGGYKLNYTNVEVIVTDHGVFANAGETTDGVVVGNGAGYLVATLNNFASIGDINETLSYLVAPLRLNTSYKGFILKNQFDPLTWPYVSLDANNTTKYLFDGNEETGEIADSTVLYLKYNGSANADKTETPTIFDYTINEKGFNNPDNLIDSVRFWTKSGWSTLGIFQHYTYVKNNVSSTVTYTDLRAKTVANADKEDDENDGNETQEETTATEWDLSNLFSSSTFVRVEDETIKKLQIDKVDSKGDAVEGAGFVLYRMNGNAKEYYTVDRNGNVLFRTLKDGETAANLALSTKILETAQTPEDTTRTTDPGETTEPAESTSDEGSGESTESTESSETTETAKAKASILFETIPDGEYFLREVTAPDGYRLLDTVITVTVTKTGITAVNLKTSENLTVVKDADVSDDGTYHFTLTLVNHRLDELPSTGGMGTFWMILTGVALIILGLIIRQNRKLCREAEESSQNS